MYMGWPHPYFEGTFSRWTLGLVGGIIVNETDWNGFICSGFSVEFILLARVDHGLLNDSKHSMVDHTFILKSEAGYPCQRWILGFAVIDPGTKPQYCLFVDRSVWLVKQPDPWPVFFRVFELVTSGKRQLFDCRPPTCRLFPELVYGDGSQPTGFFSDVAC